MKKVLFIICIYLIFSPISLFAHSGEKVSYIKINGKLTTFYPVLVSSLPEIFLPEDIAPESYIVSQPITFAIDNTILRIPEEQLKETKILWNFGDETSAQGTEVIHTYQNPGQYNVVLEANYKDSEVEGIQGTVFITVLPTQTYQLPKITIVVNGKSINDPVTDVLEFDLQKEMHFTVIPATNSGEIRTYLWDFGDGVSSTQASVMHAYNTGKSIMFPMVRVIDANGFHTDIFVQINDTEEVAPSVFNQKVFLYISASVCIILLIVRIYFIHKGS